MPSAYGDLAKLRAPFPDATVGKLPRITCKPCRDSRGGSCPDHSKSKCQGCGNYMTNAHLHLDYVGHAEVTDRLLSVDPAWDWEPMQRDVDPHLLASAIETGNPEVVREVIKNAPPKFVRDDGGRPVGLWIYLTVAGVTRKGYGSLDRPKPDGEKELIGDALRNAAMRYGVALDLWSKTELESATATGDDAPPVEQVSTAPWRTLGYADETHMRDVNDDLQGQWRALDEDRRPAVKAWLKDQGYDRPVPVRAEHADAYRKVMEGQPPAPAPSAHAPKLPPATERLVHELREAVNAVAPTHRVDLADALRQTFGFDKAEQYDHASAKAAIQMAKEWEKRNAPLPDKPLTPKIAAIVAYARAESFQPRDVETVASWLFNRPLTLADLTDDAATALELAIRDLVSGDISITANDTVVEAKA